jgi:hypothetical protein
VQWLYPGIIYAQNVMSFYRTHVHVTSLMSCWKVQPSLQQFSQNSHELNSIMCKSLMQNFTKTGQHMCKVWIQIHLCPSVTYGFQCTNFHEIYSNSMNFFVEKSYTEFHPNQINRKHEKNFIYALS